MPYPTQPLPPPPVRLQVDSRRFEAACVAAMAKAISMPYVLDADNAAHHQYSRWAGLWPTVWRQFVESVRMFF